MRKGYMMEKLSQLYDGSTKTLYNTSDTDVLILSFKDDIVDFGKKSSVSGKSAINNRMSNHIFKLLEEKGVPTHYIKELNNTETVIKAASIIPIKLILRNYASSSFAEQFGVEEGLKLKQPTIEFVYKNDKQANTFINGYHAIALSILSQSEIDKVVSIAFRVNEILTEYFNTLNIDLIDFNLELGRYKGTIILTDEFSSDICRLWDKDIHEKLDKDRFVKDLGNVQDAYIEVFNRLGIE